MKNHRNRFLYLQFLVYVGVGWLSGVAGTEVHSAGVNLSKRPGDIGGSSFFLVGILV